MSVSVWLRLGRVSNLPTVWSNVLVGVALSGQAFVGGVGPTSALLIGVVAMSLFYVGGMFLNDAFDQDFDREHKPDRPIASGEVSARSVWTAGFACLGAGIALVAAWAHNARASSTPLATASAVALAATITFYDAYHKSNPLGPLVMGLCRVLVYVTCALALSSAPTSLLLWASLGLLSHLIGLTYVAKQEDLNRLGALWPLCLLATPPLLALYLEPSPLVGAVALVHIAWTLRSLSFLRKSTRRVPEAVTRMIAGISLVDALWLSLMAPSAWVAIALLAAGLTRLGQKYVAGT